MKRSGRLAPLTLPCGHVESALTNVDTESMDVENGDCGICLECGDWWEMRRGIRVPYKPTAEDMERLRAAVERGRRGE